MTAEPPRAGVRRRVLRGAAGHAVTQPIGLLIQLAGVPLFLHFWGAALYGEWLIVAAIPVYLASSDLGFTTATQHAMTMQVSAGDQAAALRSFRTSWWVVTALSLGFCAVVTAAAWRLPVAGWLHLERLSGSEVTLLLGLLALHVLLSLQSGLLNAVFCAAGEYGQGAAFLGIGRLLEFALLAAAVVSGAGPIGAAGAYAVGRLAVVMAMRWRLTRVASWWGYGLAGFDGATARDLFGPALGFTGYTVSNALNIQGPVLVIGAVFGPAAVVPFATLRTLTRVIVQLMAVLSNIMRPEIGIATGRGDMALTRRLNRLSCRFALWTVLAVGAALLLSGDAIVAWWTGGSVAVEQPLFALLIAVVVFNTLWSTAAIALQSVNRVQGQASAYLLLSAAALATMALLGDTAGLAGPAAILTVAECVMLVHVVTRMVAYLDEPAGPFLAALLVPPFEIARHLRGHRG